MQNLDIAALIFNADQISIYFQIEVATEIVCSLLTSSITTDRFRNLFQKSISNIKSWLIIGSSKILTILVSSFERFSICIVPSAVLIREAMWSGAIFKVLSHA